MLEGDPRPVPCRAERSAAGARTSQRNLRRYQMTSLTRWTLAHKRLVALVWVVLTVAGLAAAGPASDALKDEFSVPDKEGWETNVAIAANYDDTGGENLPSSPSSRCRRAPTSTRPRSSATSPPSIEQLERACPVADRLLRLDRQRHLRLRRRLDDVRARLPAAAGRGASAPTRSAEEAASDALDGVNRRRRAGQADRVRRARRGLGRQRGPERPRRGAARRPRRARGARVRLRLDSGLRADPDGVLLDRDDVPAAARA